VQRVTIRIWPPARRAFLKERASSFLQTGSFLTSTGTFRLLRTGADVRFLIATFVIAFIYFGGAKFGLSLAFATKQVTALWPPTGIAIASLLLLGSRIWPGLFLGAFLANATSGESLVTALGIAFGNTLSGVVGVFLLRRYCKFHITLERTRDVRSLVTVAVVSTMISATLGTLNLTFADLVEWPEYGAVWSVWWIGDTLGILLFAPFLLSWWMHPRLQWRDWRFVEYLALFAGVSIVSYFTFAREIPVGQPYYLMAYATFPFLIWSAFRFEQREVVSCALIVAGIAVWGAVHDRGPFTYGTLDERLVLLDTFMAVTVVTALLLGAVTAERRRSQQRLRRARDEMERRVKERTGALERANEELYELSYSMSHDMRAPLRAVNGFSELLNEKYAGVIDSDGMRFLNIIAKNSRQMAQMIDDYLRLFRLREEALTIKPLDSDALVREVVDELFASRHDNHVKFDIRSIPSAAGDAGLIRQVWINLLDNAAKFTRNSAYPVVEVGGYVEDTQVIYYVKDNGVGFDMKWSGQLFKVFQRLHPREFEGIGMGLAIVARIVQRHGGTVHANGDVGTGATFTFSLPRQ
jgi:signal transduction histidine kinase